MEAHERSKAWGKWGTRGGEGLEPTGKNNSREVVCCVCLLRNASPYRTDLRASQEALEITRSTAVSKGSGVGEVYTGAV